MKPKRLILIFDDQHGHADLRLLLHTHGYRVLSCTSDAEREAIMGRSAVDLLVLGERVQNRYADPVLGPAIPNSYVGEVPIVQRQKGWGAADLLERVRVALVRKRGPKKAVASCRLPVSSLEPVRAIAQAPQLRLADVEAEMKGRDSAGSTPQPAGKKPARAVAEAKALAKVVDSYKRRQLEQQLYPGFAAGE